MKKVLIISNAWAADGQSSVLFGNSGMLGSDFELHRVSTQNPADVAATLKNFHRSDTAAIVVFGGDGTVNRCVEVVVNTGIPVAIFPAGTVNDLALELGMTPSWEDLRSLLQEGTLGSHPLLQVNGRYFLVYGTVGLGAETSRRIQQTRTSLRWFRSAFPTVQTPLFTLLTIFFTSGYRKKLRITLDGIDREIHTPGIYISNQKRVNRRLDLDWDRENTPGRFRIVTFKAMGRRALFNAIVRFNETGHLSAIRSEVEVFDAERAEIESMDGSPILFVADGESLAEARRLEVRLAPQTLPVYRRAVSRSRS